MRPIDLRDLSEWAIQIRTDIENEEDQYRITKELTRLARMLTLMAENETFRLREE